MIINNYFQGLGWGQCAISTSRWKGILVADLLREYGVNYKTAKAEGKLQKSL